MTGIGMLADLDTKCYVTSIPGLVQAGVWIGWGWVQGINLLGGLTCRGWGPSVALVGEYVSRKGLYC